MLLKTDKHVDNALHHAIRNGFENLAVDLLKIESRLSERENFIKESPMYMAARKGYDKIVDQLFKDENSSPKLSGPNDSSALHAAVNAGHTGIIDKLLEKRPTLARKKDGDGYTPLACAVSNNNIKIVKSLLKKDPSVAYIANEQTGATPFHVAAVSGFVLVAKEIIKCCPDCAYIINKKYSANALHQALEEDRQDFVDFIVQTPELHRLVNEAQGDGDLPLHNAARLCKSNILRSLISYKRQDYTAVNSYNHNAVDIVSENNDLLKTLKWNESFNLVSDVIPSLAKKQAQDEENKKKENSDLKKLSERQAANTALVAALLATITFAAAFTVPGGFSSSHDEGQPVFQRMAAFHAFLISDTIAMCSSLAVAFFCILTPWSDFDYLLDYKKITTLFMWCAYLSTMVAFGTGMYTVMSHEKKKQIAIPILVLCCFFPILCMLYLPKIRLFCMPLFWALKNLMLGFWRVFCMPLFGLLKKLTLGCWSFFCMLLSYLPKLRDFCMQLFRRTTQESQPSNPSPSERQTNVTGNEPQHNITAVNEPQRSADDERQPIADNNV
ncbi:hypothetical protein LUZ63_015900 [Rhynchospora breviuscula]|uniref:PGG domain-containing protein n=1 Tax=Rhynchospora breviuscula TaxID=2022672 RepID=A0A9Q0CDJ0_9POAL|nr:hypothetical protein LUZ63_015900 [Rhynchospora breviuscula]